MKFHTTAIFVKDINVSKDFYTRVLNFTIEYDFGNNISFNEGLALWAVQKEHIISKELKTKNESNKFEIYLEADNVEEICSDLENEEIKFLHKVHEEPWGQRTIRFFDPDDHLIEIGETLECFVKNLKYRELSNDQISEKTGIPMETVLSLLE